MSPVTENGVTDPVTEKPVTEDPVTDGVGRSATPMAGQLAAPRAPRSARRLFASTLLALEAFVVFFAGLAAYGLRAASPGVILAVGAVGALVCLVAAGLLRSPVGYVLGSIAQVGLVAAGVVVAEVRIHLLPVAVVFAVLWVIALQLGARIDAERATRHQAELAYWRETSGRRDEGAGT